MKRTLLLSCAALLAALPAFAQETAPAAQPAPGASGTNQAPDTGAGATTAAPATGAAGVPAQQASQAPVPVVGTMDYKGWYTFNGNLEDQKYSEADQITPQNVGKLQKAWEVHTGDVSDGSGKLPTSDWSATPLFVNDTVYVGTPFYRIFAIAPDTGKVKWTFDTHAVLKAETQPDLKTRGVAYWEAASPRQGQPCQKIVYIGTMDAKLFAVDADTGKACQDFGSNGVLDVNRWNTTNDKWPLSLLQPPTVYKDTLFIGWAGKDWADSEAPPGRVFAVNAQTGKLNWTFDALPQQQQKQTGTSNVWASMSVDPKNGILYLPVSSPSPNFYGGNRTEKLPLATSITALNADTGKVIWSRQIVHHDIWDYDTNSPPTLVDIKKDGKTIPALVQSDKMGIFFVLNRLTGEPIYPIEERKVPQTDVKGEQSAPTQPYVSTPEPTVPDKMPGISTIADVASFGQCSSTLKKLRYEGRYTPPSLQGSLAYPSTAGGVEWGGGAVDPSTGTYVVNSSYVAQIYKLIPRDEYDAITKNGTPSGYFPQNGLAVRLLSAQLRQLAGHAVLEAAIRNALGLRSEYGQAVVEEAVRREPEMGLLHATVLGLGDHRRAADHQTWPDLHRRLDGCAGTRHRPQDRQGAVARAGGCAGRGQPGHLHLQGQAVCGLRGRRQRHPEAAGVGPGRRLRAALRLPGHCSGGAILE